MARVRGWVRKWDLTIILPILECRAITSITYLIKETEGRLARKSLLSFNLLQPH
jgi:hypothetical protein